MLVQPFLERGEIVEHGGGVHLAFAGDGLESIGPRLAEAHFEHVVELGAGFLRVVDGIQISRR